MSRRVICDGGRGDRLCPAEFFEGKYTGRAVDQGWVHTVSGNDYCPAHAPKRSRKRRDAPSEGES